MIEVTPSPCKVKDYETLGTAHFVPHLLMGTYLNAKANNHCHCYDIHFFGDNRELFRQKWGKPHFHYRGEFYYHAWRFKVTLDRRTEYVYVLTAKGKGTCVERTGRAGKGDYLNISPFDAAFADWMEKVLTSTTE